MRVSLYFQEKTALSYAQLAPTIWLQKLKKTAIAPGTTDLTFQQV